MTCSKAADALVNDLTFIKHLQRYKDEIDPEIGQAALNALVLHTWYITGELVTLALFSNKTSSQQKAKIAKKKKRLLVL